MFELKSLRESLLEIVTSIGEAHLNEYMISRQLEEMRNNIRSLEKGFDEFQAKERVLFEALQQKYGTGNIDLETGEITE